MIEVTCAGNCLLDAKAVCYTGDQFGQSEPIRNQSVCGTLEQLGCRDAFSQSRQTCPEDLHMMDHILVRLFAVSLTLPATPASHGTSAKAYKKRPSPSNHRFLHLSPLALTHRRAFLLRPVLSLWSSLTSLTLPIISLSLTHQHRPSRLLAEHPPLPVAIGHLAALVACSSVWSTDRQTFVSLLCISLLIY